MVVYYPSDLWLYVANGNKQKLVWWGAAGPRSGDIATLKWGGDVEDKCAGERCEKGEYEDGMREHGGGELGGPVAVGSEGK